MRKKINLVIGIVVIAIMLTGSVFATEVNNKIKMELKDKKELVQGEEIEVKINAEEKENKLVTLEGKLEYDSEILEIVTTQETDGVSEVESQNNWEVILSKETSKIIATRTSIENGKEICTIKFRVKKSADNTEVKLKEIENFDGVTNNAQTEISLEIGKKQNKNYLIIGITVGVIVVGAIVIFIILKRKNK